MNVPNQDFIISILYMENILGINRNNKSNIQNS